MSQEKSEHKRSTKKSSSEIDTDQTVYNPTGKKEDRKQKVSYDENEMEEFNSWTKKYNFVAKEIRKNAIEQEKQELENLKKSPITKYKYFEGSKEDRIHHLAEEKRIMEDMEKLAKTKPLKDKPDNSAKGVKTETPKKDDEKEDPNFKKIRKKYHETSKEIRKNSLKTEKDELSKEPDDKPQNHVPGTKKDREKTVKGELNMLDKIQKIKTEKSLKKVSKKSKE